MSCASWPGRPVLPASGQQLDVSPSIHCQMLAQVPLRQMYQISACIRHRHMSVLWSNYDDPYPNPRLFLDLPTRTRFPPSHCNPMKILILLFSLVSTIAVAHATTEVVKSSPISDLEAAAIVEAEEKAREFAKDLREQELKKAEVRATASAAVGRRMVIFNIVEPVEPETEKASVESQSDNFSDVDAETLFQAREANQKESVQFTLSGTVWDKQVSELWWDYEGVRYRVFANANFLLFPGLGEVEDADTRYSLFTMLTDQQSNGRGPIDGKWRPSVAEFSPDALEYIVVDPKDDAKIEPEAFAGIEAMLRHYAVHHEEMQIRYDNAEKLRKARAAYLEANPPKERDTIINFRPRKITPDSLPIEK